MRIAEPLTDKKIKAARAADKPVFLYDGGGLYLEVAASGSKLWRMKYKLAGKTNRIALGRYPDTPLAEAREKRAEIRKMLNAGIDPLEERSRVAQEKDAAARELRNTFEKVAREWFEKTRAKWTEGYQKRILSRLENQLFPYIGNIPIARLETADFLAAIQKAEARGVIDTAHRLAQLCSQIARYAVHAGITKYDAASLVKGALQPARGGHFASITNPEEFGALLADVEAYQGSPATCHALRLLPYVMLRSGELRGARWSEIDFDKAQWLIPAERMKMKREHIVPLSPQAIKILESMKAYSGNSEFVFPGAFSNSRFISDMALLNALRRMGYARDRMTVHGFRSSASTMLNEQGYNPDWIEAQLAHSERNSVRAAYNRAAYLPERRKMMIEWANYIDSLRDKAMKRP